METQAILVWIGIGLVAGWLASIIVGGGGLIRYVVTGLIGAVVGGFIVRYFNVPIDLGYEFFNQVVVAAIGAIVVVLLARIIA